jgi:sugar lactone lactonase YvrE
MSSRVEAEVFIECTESGICSPKVTAQNELVFLAKDSAKILKYGEMGVEELGELEGGQPTDVFVASPDEMVITDAAHAKVFSFRPSTSSPFSPLVQEYETVPFSGPNSVCMDRTGSIFFVDSCPSSNPVGENESSLFVIQQNMLRPLIHRSLSPGSTCCCSPDGSLVFVADMHANRILRLIQHPEHIFIPSVFLNLNQGRLGPSCIHFFDNKLAIGLFDFQVTSGTARRKDGKVLIVDAEEGTVLKTIVVPEACQLTGITVNEKEGMLFVTEDDVNAIFSVSL